MPERHPTSGELDRLLDGLLTGDAADADGGLLDAARRVRLLAEEPIPTDVRDRHLAAIRAAAAEQGAPGTTTSVGWLDRMRRRAAAIAAATGLVFSATGGGAVALAQDAAPDDLLYGVKRASEQVALVVAADDASLHLRFAERRLDEIGGSPDHAADLADEAARHLGLAQQEGADLSEAGVNAVERLSEVVLQLDNENARIAVSRACARIAEKHGRDGSSCGYDGVSQPGRSGDAPGQNRDGAPGRSGDAPGRSGDARGRSGDVPAPAEQGQQDDQDEDARPDDAGPPSEAPAPAPDRDGG